MIKVRNLENRNGNIIANQFNIIQDNVVTFQSYNSVIASYDFDTKKLTVDPHYYDYSTTTGKYFNIWLDSIGSDLAYKPLAKKRKDFEDNNCFKSLN